MRGERTDRETPSRDPADHDGRADHVGRALLTSGAFGHIESIEEKR
jgi:hypothetical protein